MRVDDKSGILSQCLYFIRTIDGSFPPNTYFPICYGYTANNYVRGERSLTWKLKRGYCLDGTGQTVKGLEDLNL